VGAATGAGAVAAWVAAAGLTGDAGAAAGAAAAAAAAAAGAGAGAGAAATLLIMKTMNEASVMLSSPTVWSSVRILPE